MSATLHHAARAGETNFRMSTLPDYPLKTDCRHFRSERPCAPHKLRGKICPTCDEYDPTASRVLVVKLGAMGDVLRTTSILRGLKNKFLAPIVWVTRPESIERARSLPEQPGLYRLFSWCLRVLHDARAGRIVQNYPSALTGKACSGL